MPIFTAIGVAVAGALFGGSVLAATLISGALAFGVQLAFSYLNRPKDRAYSAVQGEIQYGADVPVGVLYGLSAVKGHRIYYAKYGSGDKYNADVFVLSNGWCDGLEPEIYFYSEKHTLVERAIIGNEVEHWGIEGFGDLVSIRFYDGRPGQGVDEQLVAATANLGREWKSTSACAGLTYVVIERQWSEEKFEKGTPEFTFILRGLREYDPRKDTTVSGGSGVHRVDDASTWGFTRNTALHRFNYQLGLKGLVSGRTLIGEGKTMGQLDLSSYVAAMNVCDTLRAGKPTYESALFVLANDDHTKILKEFDDAMAGYGMNRRGLSGVVVGAPQIPVLEITADDIPIERVQDVTRRKSAFELYNMMSGQFISPESQWKPESLIPVKVNADIAADGRPRSTANDFLQVTDADIGQYLLNIRYRQNRLGGAITLPVSWRVGLAVQEGEWVEHDGLTWLISDWRVDENFRFTLQLSQTSADIYDDEDIEAGPIVIPPTDPVNPSLLTTVQGFNAEVGMQQGEDGYEVPVLRFTWTPPADPSIAAVRFFYGFEGGTDVYQDQSTDPESGEFITDKNVASGKVYAARATITTVPDRFKTYTAWVTTGLTGRTTVVTRLDSLGEDVKAQIVAANQAVAYIRARLEQLAASASDVAGVAASSDAVAVRFRNATAAAFTQLSAEVTDLDGLLTATAETITAVLAAVGEDSAEILWRMKAIAGATGDIVSRVDLQLRATTGDDYVSSGLVLEAGYEGGNPAAPFSRVLLYGSEVVIANAGGDVAALFETEAGNVYFRNVFIHNLDATNITADKLDATEILQDGTLITELFAFGAVTEYEPISYSASLSSGSGEAAWTHHLTVIVDNPAENPTIEFISLSAFATEGGGVAGADAYIVVRRNGSATNVADGEDAGQCRRNSDTSGNGTTNFSATTYLPAGDDTTRYDVWTWNTRYNSPGASSSLTVTCSSGVLFWKR